MLPLRPSAALRRSIPPVPFGAEPSGMIRIAFLMYCGSKPARIHLLRLPSELKRGSCIVLPSTVAFGTRTTKREVRKVRLTFGA